MDMEAFLKTLTPAQRAALQAANDNAEAEAPTPAKANAKRKAKIGQAKPREADDDNDEDETVPEAVAKVQTGKLAVVPPHAKRTTSGPVLTDSHGRKLPVACVPVSVTFTWADGREQTLSITPKTFSTGSVGGNCPGKLSVPSPDGRPLQVSLNLIYVKPKGDE